MLQALPQRTSPRLLRWCSTRPLAVPQGQGACGQGWASGNASQCVTDGTTDALCNERVVWLELELPLPSLRDKDTYSCRTSGGVRAGAYAAARGMVADPSRCLLRRPGENEFARTHPIGTHSGHHPPSPEGGCGLSHEQLYLSHTAHWNDGREPRVTTQARTSSSVRRTSSTPSIQEPCGQLPSVQ